MKIVVSLAVLSVMVASVPVSFAMGSKPKQGTDVFQAPLDAPAPSGDALQQEESQMAAQGGISMQQAAPSTQTAAPSMATIQPRFPVSTREEVTQVQTALKAAGFDPGPIDGKWGAKTEQAVKNFQSAKGLTVDGKVGPKTWASLQQASQSQ